MLVLALLRILMLRQTALQRRQSPQPIMLRSGGICKQAVAPAKNLLGLSGFGGDLQLSWLYVR